MGQTDNPQDATAEVFTVGSFQSNGLTTLEGMHVNLLETGPAAAETASAAYTAASTALAQAIERYEVKLRAHSLDTTAETVRSAARHLSDTIINLGVAHTRLTGASFPTGLDSAAEWHGEVEGDDQAEVWDPAFPPPNEIPALIASNVLLAEGPWGVISLRGFLVHSNGVRVDLDWVLRRNGADAQRWQEAWSIFDWWTGPEESLPVTVPEGYTVADHGQGASGADQSITGLKSLWVVPLPTISDINLALSLPRLGLDALAVTIPAAAVNDAARLVRTVAVVTSREAPDEERSA